jgi:hypothetical protein
MRPVPPPPDLATARIPLHTYSAGIRVFRIWQKHHSSPFFWSKKKLYRFDSKSAPYGVLYTAATLEGALLEVFADQWIKQRVLSRALLANYRASVIGSSDTLRLVDTTDQNLNKLGVDSMFFASTNYRLTRAWARAFMKHPSNPEGILYHSRKNPLLFNLAFFG